ncbi:MAG: choice-of-anchor D domain-containing protein [Aquimonas sp.]|nr:choice-of-anchor D domain-containing protein [Aquimonas sp.]
MCILSVTGRFEDLGSAVSGAGDINGDGIDDLIVGAPGTSGQNGAAQVVFGAIGEQPIDMLASSRLFGGLDGRNGFSVWPDFYENFFGNAVSRLGDFSGVGVDDIVIGARSSNQQPGRPGRAIVVFGGLTGPGEVPVAGLSQTALDFGDVVLGQTSAAQTITLTNTGCLHALELGALALSGAHAGDFSVSNDSCSNRTLTQGATCSFQITLSPSAPGMRSAVVDIPSNAPSGPDVVTLDGVGEALADAVFSDGFEGD